MLLAVLFLPVMSDAAEMPSFHDGADIVKGEAAAEVKNALETVEKKHNVRIAVVTQPSVEGMKIGDYADKLLGTVIKGGKKEIWFSFLICRNATATLPPIPK